MRRPEADNGIADESTEASIARQKLAKLGIVQ